MSPVIKPAVLILALLAEEQAILVHALGQRHPTP